MSSGLQTRPSATTYEVERLVRMAWNGEIRVPHFQRSMRWGKEDIIRLFDSISRGYPVGNILLWARSAPAEDLTLGALKINAPELQQALWVVDGQQRVTSLANALSEEGAKDPRFAIAYDLKEERFISQPAAEEPYVVPLPVLFHLPRLLSWFAENPDVSELQNRAFELTTRLRQYPVPAYQVEQENVEVLQDIFDRMNTYGKRLSRAEIFHALHPGDETSEEQVLTGELIAGNIDGTTEFGRIDPDTLLYALLARRGPDVSRDPRQEFTEPSRRGADEFPGEDRDAAFQAGEEALHRAVSFLQTDAVVPHFTLLPYRYLLVVLARLFGHFPEPDPVNRRLLRRWFWRAAIAGPNIFTGSTTGAMRKLCRTIRPDDLSGSVRGLLEAVDDPHARTPDIERFTTNEAAAKITLCSWWRRQPRDPSSGAVYETQDLAEALTDRNSANDAVRRIIPSRMVDRERRLWAANRILIPRLERAEGKDIGSLFVHQPTGVDESTWTKVMESHLMTGEMVDLIRRERTADFLAKRQEHVAENLDTFLKNMCESGFEDTPPLEELVIEDLEDGGPDGP